MSAPESQTTVAGGGAIAPCCLVPENRRAEPHPTDPETWTVERCAVCQRRHITLHVNLAEVFGSR